MPQGVTEVAGVAWCGCGLGPSCGLGPCPGHRRGWPKKEKSMWRGKRLAFGQQRRPGPDCLKRAAVFLEVEGDLGGGAASSCPHVLPLASRPDPSGHAGVPCGGDAGWPCVELGSYLSMSVGSEAVRCVPFRNPCLFGRTPVMLPKGEHQSECRRGPSQPRRAGTRLQGF